MKKMPLKNRLNSLFAWKKRKSFKEESKKLFHKIRHCL